MITIARRIHGDFVKYDSKVIESSIDIMKPNIVDSSWTYDGINV